MRRTSALLVVTALSLAGAELARGQFGPGGPDAITTPAEKTGWWIRINPQNQAARVYWRFGAAPNQLGAPAMWVRGESPEAVDAPADQRTLDTVHLAFLGMPPAAPVSLCLFFQDRGVSLIEFTQEQTTQVDRTGSAPECTP